LFGIWQLANLFKLFEFDVIATIQDNQPGSVAGADGNWTPPFVPSANVSGSGGGSFTVNWQPGGTGSEGTGDDGGETGDDEQDDDYTPPVINSGGGSGGGGGGGTPAVTIVTNSNGLDIIKVTPEILDFGYCFPGEMVTLSFSVELNTDIYGTVNYSIELAEPDGGFAGAYDIRPYLIVEKYSAETDVEPDDIADGTVSDYDAEGIITDTDTNPINEDEVDIWEVKFYVPDQTGNYWAWIKVEPISWEEVTLE
jgi:hypothetical protein